MARFDDFIEIALNLGGKVSDETPCYIGVNKDGRCRAAAVDRNDRPDHAKEMAKTLSRWIKDGMTVERTTVEVARKRLAED